MSEINTKQGISIISKALDLWKLNRCKEASQVLINNLIPCQKLNERQLEPMSSISEFLGRVYEEEPYDAAFAVKVESELMELKKRVGQ